MPIQKLIWCPRYVKNITDGWRRKKTPIYFVEGRIFHENAALIMKGEFSKKYSVDKRVEKIKESLVKGEYEDENGDIMVFDADKPAYKNKKSDLTVGDQAAKRVSNQIFKLVETQMAGEYGDLSDAKTEHLIEVHKLIDPSGGPKPDIAKKAEDMNIVFSGRLDLETPNGIHDFKTCSPSHIPNARGDEQLLHYAYLSTIERNELVKRGFIHAFTKHITKTDYHKTDETFTMGDFQKWYDNLLHVLDLYIHCVENDKWPQHGYMGGCNDMYFQKCLYHPVCFPEKYSPEEHEEAMGNLRKEEEDER